MLLLRLLAVLVGIGICGSVFAYFFTRDARYLALADESWGVTVEYEDSGYVSDEDAGDIDYGDMLKDMSAASRASTDAGMIEQLFEHGRRQAKRWLSRNFAAVGERSSVNLRKDYADDMVINA